MARDSVRFAGKSLATIAPADLTAFQTYQDERAEFMQLRQEIHGGRKDRTREGRGPTNPESRIPNPESRTPYLIS